MKAALPVFRAKRGPMRKHLERAAEGNFKRCPGPQHGASRRSRQFCAGQVSGSAGLAEHGRDERCRTHLDLTRSPRNHGSGRTGCSAASKPRDMPVIVPGRNGRARDASTPRRCLFPVRSDRRQSGAGTNELLEDATVPSSRRWPADRPCVQALPCHGTPSREPGRSAPRREAARVRRRRSPRTHRPCHAGNSCLRTRRWPRAWPRDSRAAKATRIARAGL